MGTRYRAFTQEHPSAELARELVCTSRQEEQLTRMLILLMSGASRTFYGGRDEKTENTS